jgi:conjugative relaxase-like TrwC/TraI family protein
MSGRDRGEYFLSLTEYYAGGGRVEPDGVWLGEGAKALGLEGRVKRRDLRRLLDGFSKEGAPLVQNAGKEGRFSGFDCVMAAPKSVSVVWGSRPEHRGLIERAHDEAVRRTVAEVERLAGRSRRGHGGAEVVPAKIVVAAFQHGSSRAGDELLHTHALVLLPVVREDGTTGALDTRRTPIFLHQQGFAAFYRANLSYLLEREGFRLERKETWFEITGLPEGLVKASSKRREEILEAATPFGKESPEGREVARLETRREKELLPRERYYERWERRAAEHGLTDDLAKAMRGPVKKRDIAAELPAALGRAVKRATAESAHFTEPELLRYAAEEAQCGGFDPTLLPLAVKHRLMDPRHTVKLGHRGGEVRYTTPEMMELERRMLDAAAEMHEGENNCKAPPELVEEAIRQTEKAATERARAKDPGAPEVRLNAEQRAALVYATGETSRIKVIEGYAGTGKTTLMAAVAAAVRLSGRASGSAKKVIGCSTAGKAVRGLAEEAGIESYTLARLVGAPAFQFVGDFDRPDDGKPRVKLDQDTLVVLDEAFMTGLAVERLVREVHATGATLLAVGDRAQLQAVASPGGFFRSVADRFGCVKLTENTRTKVGWEKEAVKHFPAGDPEKAIRAYAERGLVWVEPTREEAIRKLVAEWAGSGGASDPRRHQVFVLTNEERRAVNAAIQERLREEGRLGSASVEIKDSDCRRGDRVRFLRKSKAMGVENGDLGTATGVDPFGKTVEVELDRGGKVVVDAAKYGAESLTLSFGITTHVSQGTSVDFAYLLTGGPMTDLHSAYVQGTRAKYGTKYFTDELSAGDDLADLCRRMSRRREKDLAHDVSDGLELGQQDTDSELQL